MDEVARPAQVRLVCRDAHRAPTARADALPALRPTVPPELQPFLAIEAAGAHWLIAQPSRRRRT